MSQSKEKSKIRKENTAKVLVPTEETPMESLLRLTRLMAANSEETFGQQAALLREMKKLQSQLETIIALLNENH